MRVTSWMVAPVVPALVLVVAGCSPSVDSACDVDGVSKEIEHMVGESNLALASLESLKCSGSWAVAEARVSGDGQGEQTSTFLFEKTESGWFLKSPEIACGNDPGMETVPEVLKAEACPGQ